MWGPCFGHKRAMFWAFQARGLQDKPSNVKFGMDHPWAHWLRFRKNQFEGPCVNPALAIKGHILAISRKGSYMKKAAMWIWHGTSIGTLIKIQEEPILRTMWGPSFGHKRAVFWPFLGKVNYGIHPKFWNLAWSIPGQFDYDSGRTNFKDHVRTMFWPQKGHILAISRERKYGIHP